MALFPALFFFASVQGSNLIANGNFVNGLDSWEGGGSKLILSEGGHKFLRAVIKRKPIQPWEVMISQHIDARLPKGSDVSITFEARSSTSSKVNGMIEDAGQPYSKYLSATFPLSPEWKPCYLKGTLEKDIELGSTQLTFHFGLDAGTIDIRNIQLTSPGVALVEDKYPQRLFEFGPREGLSPMWQTEGKAKPTTQTISSNSKEFPLATRATVNSVGNNPWDSQIGYRVEPGIRQKSIAYMRAWLRSSDKVTVTMVYEQSVAPNNKVIFEAVVPDTEWREYKVAVPAGFSLPANGSQAKLFFEGKGVVDVGPVTLDNLGPKVAMSKVPQFLGANQYRVDPAWRAKNDREIAALRKGKMTILVTNGKGQPVKGQVVKIHQDAHQFRFGTALPASLLLQDDDDGKKFRSVVKQMFNTVTFGNDLKWNVVGPDIFQDWIYPARTWLRQNNIELRGHNLVWGSYKYLPAVDKSWSKERTWEEVQRHVRDYAIRMKGKVYLWDVVNEAVTETELWDKVGWDKFAEVYKIARQYDPAVKLAYNDFDMNNEGHRAGAIARANAIKAAGAPIDVFGDQSHLSRPALPPARLKALWDDINAKTGLPIEVTEFDFSTFDDQLQADYVEDFYRAAFAHPKMQAIIMWGFWERDHWLANKGGHMIQADWTWRPAMKAVNKLINQRWKTNVELKTDANGRVQVPAFFGKYTITVGGKVVKANHYAQGTVVRIL